LHFINTRRKAIYKSEFLVATYPRNAFVFQRHQSGMVYARTGHIQASDVPHQSGHMAMWFGFVVD